MDKKGVKKIDWMLIIALVLLVVGFLSIFLPEPYGFYLAYLMVISIILFLIFHIYMLIDMAKRKRWVMFIFALIFTLGLIGILLSLEHYFSVARKDWVQNSK